MAAIEISEKAAVRIKTLIGEKGTPAGGLRLGVKGGGCSGLNYHVDWAAGAGAGAGAAGACWWVVVVLMTNSRGQRGRSPLVR